MRTSVFLLFTFAVFLLRAQGNDCHMHTVKPGEGVYSISRLYVLKPSQLMSANPEIGKEMVIKAGQKLCIPKSSATISAEQIEEAKIVLASEKAHQKNMQSSSPNPLKQGDLWVHTVQKGETFYAICKLYGILAYDLISTNNLPNTLLNENQKLILPPSANIPGQQALSETNKPVSPMVEMVQRQPEEVKSESAELLKTKPVIKKEDATKTKTKAEKVPVQPEAKPVIESKVEEPLKAEQAAPSTAPKVQQNLHDDAALAPAIQKHTVQKGDTYFSLSRKFNLKPGDIKKWNNLPSTDIKIGQELIVSNPAVISATQEDDIPKSATVINISEEVAKKKKADDVVIEKPKEEVVVRQENVAATERWDLVPQVKPEPQKNDEAVKHESVLSEDIKIGKTITAKPVLSFSEEYGEKYASMSLNNSYRISKMRTVGKTSPLISGNDYLVYFNGAPSGSIVKITNLMSRQSAFAKVVGAASDDESASLLVSKKLASELKTLDDSFLVEVSLHKKN